MGSEAKWIEGWFTKPGLYWCVTTTGSGLRIAEVRPWGDRFAARIHGYDIAQLHIKFWLDAEIVPPAPPGEEA